MQVTANLMQEFARQVLAFNTKVRILGQKRLRDRLKIYLQTLTTDDDGVYTLPYSRSALADFLCVDRSALSRELCRMRDEGILSFRAVRFLYSIPDFCMRKRRHPRKYGGMIRRARTMSSAHRCSGYAA